MSVTKQKRRTGTVYVVRVDMGRTMDGKRDQKQVTCSTKREAEKIEHKLLDMKAATRGRSGRITLRAYIDTYYAPLMSNLADSSRDTYEREIRLRILPALGNLDVRDITRSNVQHMIDGCSTKSVAKKALGVLKTIMGECMADGIIPTNPAKLRYRMPDHGRKRDNGLVIGTYAGMSELFTAVDEYDDPTITVLTTTGLLMGLRPEERYGLDRTDLDFSSSTAHIQRAYLPVSKAAGTNVLKGPKTDNGDRYIPIPPDAARRLIPLGEKANYTGPVMSSRDGKRLSPSTAQKRWTRFLRWTDAKNLNVPHVTIENMRHSFATSFLDAGGNVENLSRILGHADINTTYRRYVRPTVDNLAADMSRVRL